MASVPLADAPAVPGYLVVRALGRDRWLARGSSGRLVELRRWPVPGDRARLDHVSGQVTRLPVSSLLPFRVADGADAVSFLVSEHAPGGTLAALLERRGRLEPGEIVTLGVAVADALAALHAAGLVHGAVDADAVRLDLDGTPLLAEPGLVPGSAEHDTAALARLCRAALGDRTGEETPTAESVRHVLSRGDEPAEQLAARLRAAAPAVALRLPPAAPVSAPELPRPSDPSVGRRLLPRPSRAGAGEPRASWRAALLAAAVVVALLLSGAVGVWWAHRDDPRLSVLPERATRSPGGAPHRSAGSATAPPRRRALSAPPGPSAGWPGVIARLDAARAAAFAAGSVAQLRRVDYAGSVAWRRDAAALAALRGARPRGLRWDVLGAVPVDAVAGTVTLVVTDRMPAYDVVRAGRVVGQVPARGMRNQVWLV
jgi:hypothetical protein